MDVYEKLREMGLHLNPPSHPAGIYKPVKQVGNLLYVSGQTPKENNVVAVSGKVGAERTIEEGQHAARLCTLSALSHLDNYIGDLNNIKSLVKTLGFVASAPNFNNQPAVINGASALLRDLFGEDAGVGARSSIGVSELPGNAAVEIEFIFEI